MNPHWKGDRPLKVPSITSDYPKYRKTLCLTFKMLVIKLVTRRILYLCRNPRERQDSQVANQVSFRGRQQRKKALKMSKLKPRKTNRLWTEKRPSKIFRRTSRILYPSVIQSCTAITISAIMPPTRNWTSSLSAKFCLSVSCKLYQWKILQRSKRLISG